MGKRKRRLGSHGLERVAFVLLLGVVAALLVASTRIGDDADAPPPQTAATPQDVLRSGPLTARVAQTAVVPATSAAGRRRDRVRVVVAVALTNASSSSVSARRALRLEYSGRTVFPDPSAKDARVLDVKTPLAANATRQGELRFELAGEDTRVLRNRGDARLILVAPGARRDGVTLEFDVEA